MSRPGVPAVSGFLITVAAVVMLGGAPANAQTTVPVGGGGGTTTPVSTVLPITTPITTPVTTIPTPSSTVEDACTSFPAPTVVFVGTVKDRGPVVVTFNVEDVRSGAFGAPRAAAGRVEVDVPDDARFLRQGERYLVAALEDAESGRLSSKIRRPRDESLSAACTANDLVVIRNADGSAIDTGVLAGMHGKWGRALLLVLLPLVGVLAVLTVLVLLKHLVLFGVRLPGRVRAGRERRSSRGADHPAPADEAPTASRR